MERYVGALRRELEWIPPGSRLTQLFVGGGTPTALPADLLDEVLGSVFRRVVREGERVHTVETSPETISNAHLDVMRRHGVGRVSMGVQSMVPEVLDTVHRQHEVAEALAACELLVGSGLVVNVDLIYGLPGQTPESFLADLTTLARLGVPALTCYSLRVTKRTPVTRVLGREPFDVERLMAWRGFVKKAAESLGYTQTRWHTFKRLDSIATTHEWMPTFDKNVRGFQLGVGMSARSNLGHAVYRNHPVHDAYIERIERGESPVDEVYRFDDDDRMTQFVARSLGDGKPLVRADFEATFGRAVEDEFGDVLDLLRTGGLVDDDGAVVVLTERGKLVYDLVTLAFYPQRARVWLAARESSAAFVSATPSLAP
jgi:oxygen-independent coproporphyrinogen-3 oxidase